MTENAINIANEYLQNIDPKFTDIVLRLLRAYAMKSKTK